MTCYFGAAQAKQPIWWIDDSSAEYEYDDVWTDWFGNEQACGFPFRVDYDDRWIIHVKDNGDEIWNVTIRDTYTNLNTGYSFEDFASYSIKFDAETGLADHRGAFWRIRVPGTGMVVLDVGGFLQDWYDDDWPVVPGSLIGNNHDFNGAVVPPPSYCDLMAENY
jgi:hypothetical protein